MALGNKRGQYAPPAGQPYPYPQNNPYRPNIPQPGAFGATPSQPSVSISPRTLLIVGGIALLIILTFVIIFVVRANMPSCPDTITKGPCDLDAHCGKDTNYQIVHTPKPSCDIDLETKKLACTGKAGALAKFFDTKREECVTDVDPTTKITPYTSTERTSGSLGKLRVVTQLNQPFNLNADQIAIEVTAEELDSTGLRVTHLEVDGSDAARNVLILGEDTLNRPIAAVQAPVKLWLKTAVPGSDVSGSLKDLKLLIDVAYSLPSGTSVQDKTERLTIPLRNLVFSWLRPSRIYDCPDPKSCDDGDPSTRDYCDPADPPFCKHTAITGACGNGVCESNENKCTCAADCGSCSDSGKVTTSQCVNNACIVQLRPDTTVQPIATNTQNNLGKASLTTSLNYNNPFNAKSDTLNVKIVMDQKDPTIDSVTIDSIELDKGAGVLVASAKPGTSLSGAGSSAASALSVGTALTEEDMTPQLKVFYTISAQGKTDKSSYTVAVQKLTVYSP